MSVSLAGSPVNFQQRAVRAECWQRDTKPPSSTALSSTSLCFVFQLTGQRERERQRYAGSEAASFLASFQTPVPHYQYPSELLCFLLSPLFLSSARDESQLFQGNTSQIHHLKTASRDSVGTVKNASVSYLHTSFVIVVIAS